MSVSRASAVASLLLVCLTVPVRSQCPDGTPPPCASRPRHVPSVAVLFMEQHTRSGGDSLLAEGLTLEIIDQLGRINRLDVRSRFASKHIAAAADPIADARAMGVDYIVDGVLDIDTARVLMRGALTRTTTGRVVRTVRVDRPRSQLDVLQAQVAQDVAAAVVGELAPAERSRFAARRADPAVVDLVLRARALNGQYTAAAYRQALRLLNEAMARDSTVAQVWSELTTTLILLRDFTPDSSTVYTDRAAAAARRALALDSLNGPAMAFVALTRMVGNDAGPETEAMARRAMMLDRSAPTALYAAVTLIGRGRVDDALAAIRAAAERDSLSPVIWVAYAFRLANARRYSAALRALEHADALRGAPTDTATLAALQSHAMLERGDCTGALSAAMARRDRSLAIQSLHCLGRTAAADSVAQAQLADTATGPVDRALDLAWLGQPDSALARLDRLRPRGLAITLQQPALERYRQHPAYLALRHQLGLDR